MRPASYNFQKYPLTCCRNFLLVFFSLLTPIALDAQTGSKSKMKFEHLDLALNNNMVEALLQDSEGYMWIGTLGGLHRYDGVNLVLYENRGDTVSLNGNRVGELFEDSQQRLWIGTENGIYQYIRELDQFRKLPTENDFVDPANPRPDRSEAIIEDENGTIWIANERSGLQFFNENEQQFETFFKQVDPDSIRFEQAVSLTSANDGVLWMGTAENGLVKVNVGDKSYKRYKHDNNDPASVAGTYLEDIHVDQEGILWIATRENGLDIYDTKKDNGIFKHYRHEKGNPNSLFNDDVTTVYEDRSGQMWICNENGGLHLYNPAQDNFKRHIPMPTDPFSISNIAVKAVFEDDQGRFWIGTNLEGVDVSDKFRYKFDHYQKTENSGSLNNNIIRSFFEEQDGNLWIATDGGGLNYFDRSTGMFTAYTNDPTDPRSLSSNAVLTIEEDRNGKLWIGTWRGSINIFDRSGQTFTQPYAEIHDVSKVYYLLKDNLGNIWAGAQTGGLSRFSNQGQHEFTWKNDPNNPSSIGDNDVVVVFQDSQDRIWIGTEYNGLNQVIRNPESGKFTFRRYPPISEDSTSLPNIKVNHIYEDSKRNLWIATEGGLSKYLPETENFRNFFEKDGLESNSVKSIVEDDKGYLWMGTSKGLTRFDSDKIIFRNYSSFDGLQNGEFSRYAVLKSRSGELIFGGHNGFNIFNPDSLVDNPYPPKVHLTQLNIFNQEIKAGDNSVLSKVIGHTDRIFLDHNQSVISIDYIGINFTQPNRNQYAYRMLGFEEDWNLVGTERKATYTNLDPGEYTFEVKASNNDGLWSTENASINITIIPPWWQTAFFRAILIIILVGSILGIIKYRTIAYKREQRLLESLVDERTKEVKKLNQDLAISEKMASLGVLSAGIAHEINNPINFISGASKALFEFLNKKQKDDPFQNEEEVELVRKLGDAIEVGVKRTTEIIHSLRNYANNRPDVFEVYNIVQCVDDAILILSHKLKNGEIDVEKDYPEKVEMLCIPGRISQIFINLMNNSIDAIEKDGKIRIAIQENDFTVDITLKDSGVGIKEEDVPHLFDPFYSTKEVGKGTGLGLYLVHGIVQDHKGKIDVSSDRNETAFTIRLPINKDKTASLSS